MYLTERLRFIQPYAVNIGTGTILSLGSNWANLPSGSFLKNVTSRFVQAVLRQHAFCLFQPSVFVIANNEK
jgi:hypothetical protein